MHRYLALFLAFFACFPSEAAHPTVPYTEINRIKAVPGQTDFQLEVPFSFLNSTVRDAAVTALGISSTGSVATDSLWDAVGDLAVGSGSNTAVRLAKGNALQVLRVNSAATALEWATVAGTGDAMTTGTLAQFAATTSSQLAGVISNETGTGPLVFASSPVFTTPNLGAAVATTLNGVTYASGTGSLSIGTSVVVAAQSTRIPIAAQDLTFTGPSAARAYTLPDANTTLVGTSTAQALTGKTYNGLAITTTTGTLTIASGKTATFSNTLTLAGTDGSTLSIGTGGTLGTAAFMSGPAGAIVGTTDTQTLTGKTISGSTNTLVNIPLATAVTGTLPVTNGGTGRATGTTAYALIATGTTATGAQQTLPQGLDTELLVGGGGGGLPVWTTATGTGAPVRATSPVLSTPTVDSLSSEGSIGIGVPLFSDGTLDFYNDANAFAVQLAADVPTAFRLARFIDASGNVLLDSAIQTITNKSIVATQLTGTIAAARMPAFTGDITSSAGAVATTLATVNGNVGTFGSATKASIVTVNGKGLITAASESTVTPAIGSITGLGTGVGTFLATPSSANLLAALTTSTGAGSAVFATAPSLTALTTDQINVAGNLSAAAWTTSGIRFKGTPGTLTDTTSSGTVAAAYTNKYGANTIAASAATTFTNYISSYVSDPIAGTNVTMTNKWAIGGDSLRIGTSNQLTVSNAGVLTLTGAAVLGTPASIDLTNASGLTAAQINAPLFASDAGANDTYTATLSPALGAYVTGNHYRFKANTSNTGAASINFNALGAKTIVKVASGITTTLADNDIRSGQWVAVVYDGTNMQMQSTLGNAASGGSSPTTTRGDLIRRGASADERVALGVVGSKIESDGTDVVWSYPGADCRYENDFLPGQPGSGTNHPIEDWYRETIVSGGSTAFSYGLFSHPGVARLTTGTTAAQGYALFAGDNGTPAYGILNGDLSANAGWKVTFIFRLGPAEANTTNHSMRIGLRSSGSANEPTSWMGLRYDTALSDTSFTFCTRLSSSYGTQSTTNSIAADNAWHRFVMRSTTAGTVLFSLDGGTETSSSTSILTSTTIVPFFQIVNNATSTARTLDCDFFGYFVKGLNR